VLLGQMQGVPENCGGHSIRNPAPS
jgi:hypothetical protein